MRLSRESLLYIREQIELHTEIDPSLTDVIITYQIQDTGKPKKFLHLSIKLT